MYLKDSKSSEGNGIDSEEAKRSPLSQGFPLNIGNSENLETTAIRRTIRNRNGSRKPSSTVVCDEPEVQTSPPVSMSSIERFLEPEIIHYRGEILE